MFLPLRLQHIWAENLTIGMTYQHLSDLVFLGSNCRLKINKKPSYEPNSSLLKRFQ